MKPFNRIAIPLILLALPMVLATAQPFEDGPASEKIQQLRRIKLIEALDLDEEQSIRLFARENEFRKEQKELFEKRNAAINKLHDLIKEDATESELAKAIEAVRKIDGEFPQRRFDFIMSLSDILTMKQIGQMVVFEQKFSKEIRQILESLRERRPPPPERRRR